MNPRYRRLLIPGLLVLLMVVVVVSSLARRADGAVPDAGLVSRMSDPAISESSGLAISGRDDDLVYTVNDSGNDAVIFAVDLSSGDTVGTLTPGVAFDDAEALSIDGDDTLWVADTGDNDRERDDVALYAVEEFGRTTGSASAQRYPLTYPDAPRDVESLVINPQTGAKFLLTKGLLGGAVFALPATLTTGANRVEDLGVTVPGLLTDAAFTPDGRHVVARDYSRAYVLDPATWDEVDSVELPPVEQGETLAVEAGGATFLVGSEGEGSPLIRVPLDRAPAPTPTPDADPSATATPAEADQEPSEGGNGFAGTTWFWAAIVIALLGAISVAATRRS
ncbi:MAG: hypothetical protein JWP31_2174 [Aeromicrobium sp.]|nr:hypothetical protein [Aeromicrobium sp.]